MKNRGVGMTWAIYYNKWSEEKEQYDNKVFFDIARTPHDNMLSVVNEYADCPNYRIIQVELMPNDNRLDLRYYCKNSLKYLENYVKEYE
jgi:hypothetical protein